MISLLCPNGTTFDYYLPEQLFLFIIVVIIGIAIVLIFLACVPEEESEEKKFIRRLYKTYGICRSICSNRDKCGRACRICIIDEIEEFLEKEKKS